MRIFIIKIRRSWHNVIFIMGIPLLGRQHLYVETPQVRDLLCLVKSTMCLYKAVSSLSLSYHWFQVNSVIIFIKTLRWRHNDHDCVSNHQPRHCLLNRLFGRRSKKTSKLRVTGLCVGNSPRPVNSPHKGPVTRKMFPFDDVIINLAVCKRRFEQGE